MPVIVFGIRRQVLIYSTPQGPLKQRVFVLLSDLHSECECGHEGLYWLTRNLPNWLACAQVVLGYAYGENDLVLNPNADSRYSSFFTYVPLELMVHLLLRWGDDRVAQRGTSNQAWCILDGIASRYCVAGRFFAGSREVRVDMGLCSGLSRDGDDQPRTFSEALLRAHTDWIASALSQKAGTLFRNLCTLLSESMILGGLADNPFSGQASFKRPRKAREPLDPDLAASVETAAVQAGSGTAQRLVRCGRAFGQDLPGFKSKATFMKARAYFLAVRRAMVGSVSDAIALDAKRFSGKHWVIAAFMRADTHLVAWLPPQVVSGVWDGDKPNFRTRVQNSLSVLTEPFFKCSKNTFWSKFGDSTTLWPSPPLVP